MLAERQKELTEMVAEARGGSCVVSDPSPQANQAEGLPLPRRLMEKLPAPTVAAIEGAVYHIPSTLGAFLRG